LDSEPIYGDPKSAILPAIGWVLLLSIATLMLNLATTILIGRLEGSAALGKYAVWQLTIGLFVGFGSLGLTGSAGRLMAQRNPDQTPAGPILRMAYRLSWISGLSSAILLIGFSQFFSADILENRDVAGFLTLGAFCVPFAVVSGIQSALLQAAEQFRTLVRISLPILTASFIFQLFGLNYGGLEGLILGTGIGYVLQVVVLHKGLMSWISQAGELGRGSKDVNLRQMLIPGIGLVAINVVVNLATWFSWVLVARSPIGFVQLATLSIARSWAGLVQFVPGVVLRVLSARVWRTFGRPAGGTGAMASGTMLRYAVMTGLTGAVVILFSSDWIYGIYGHSSDEGAAVLAVLCVVALLDVAGNVRAVAAYGLDRTWRVFWVKVFTGALLVAITYAGVRTGYGTLGYAAGCLVAALLSFAAMFRFVDVNSPPSRIDEPVRHA
jgi:O-antigen/teichoic acid export membrane protein